MNLIFDTHAHYDDEAFDADREALLSSMPENGVGLIVDADNRGDLDAAITEFNRRSRRFGGL